MEIRGGNKLTIVRQLADPADTNTYYVQAVIVNSATGSVMNTLSLTDGGDQRFSYVWTVPYQADEFQIDIKTTVYTDSGYTTKSNRYTIENRDYMIRHKVLGGGGGGSSISYKKIQTMIDGAVPEIPYYDKRLQRLEDTLLLATETNRRAIKDIDIPKYDEKILMGAVKDLKGYINDIEIPESDYKPLMKEINDLKIGIENSTKKLNDKSDKLEKSYSKFEKSLKDTLEDVKKNLEYIVKTFNLSELCDGFTKFMTGEKKEKPSIADKAKSKVNNYYRPR